jgi:hypothetical protein
MSNSDEYKHHQILTYCHLFSLSDMNGTADATAAEDYEDDFM